MAQVTKKKTKNEYRNTMIICFVLAGILLVVGAIYVALSFDYMVLGKTKNLNTEIYEGKAPTKGDYVDLNVNLVLGNYAETKHKINGIIPIGTDQHYAIVLFDQNENLYVMSLTLKNKSDIEALEAMVNPTWDLLTGTSQSWPTGITLTGKITTMDSQIKGFYKQQLATANVTKEYFKDIYELTLDATESRLSKWLYTGFFLLLAGLFIAGAFGARSSMKKVENIQAIARENAADPSLNPFLTGGNAPGNPYTGSAQQPDVLENPYAASMNNPAGTDNPYSTAPGADTSNPYAAPGADTSNPYSAAAGADTGNPYSAAAGNPYSTSQPGSTENPYAAPTVEQPQDIPLQEISEADTTVLTSDSMMSDSYNSDSYDPS